MFVFPTIDLLQVILLAIFVFVFWQVFWTPIRFPAVPVDNHQQCNNDLRSDRTGTTPMFPHSRKQASNHELQIRNNLLQKQNETLRNKELQLQTDNELLQSKVIKFRTAAVQNVRKRVVHSHVEAALLMELDAIQQRTEEPNDTVARLSSAIVLLETEKAKNEIIEQSRHAAATTLRRKYDHLQTLTNRHRNETERFRNEVIRLKRKAQLLLVNTIQAQPVAPPLPLAEAEIISSVSDRNHWTHNVSGLNRWPPNY